MRFYIDTSVFGGYDDDEFKKDTIPFFHYMEKSGYEIIYSDITLDELLGSPPKIRSLMDKELKGVRSTYIQLDEEVKRLASHYIKEGALTKKSKKDALHIAAASIYKADTIVSWNFKHMVNSIRIRHYNSINLKFGYSTIDIRTPKEMLP